MGIAPIGLVLSKIANPQGAAAAVLGASGGTAQAPTDKYSARVDLQASVSVFAGWPAKPEPPAAGPRVPRQVAGAANDFRNASQYCVRSHLRLGVAPALV